MRPSVDNKKYMEVSRLNEGDIILLTTGDKVIFGGCMQKNFVGTYENGKRYKIFINKFDKLILKADSKVRQTNINNSLNKEMQVRNLNVGDKVKLTNGDIAEFVKVNVKKFVGIINSQRYVIPFEMFESKVDDNTQAVSKRTPKTVKTNEEKYGELLVKQAQNWLDEAGINCERYTFSQWDRMVENCIREGKLIKDEDTWWGKNEK
jgi:hypothetical protein